MALILNQSDESWNLLPVIRIGWSVIISELLDNIRQSIVFPADEDVAGSRVVLDNLLDTLRVITIAASVHCDTEVFSERLNSIIRTSSSSAYIRELLEPVLFSVLYSMGCSY
jgi:hypothetical protein